MEIDIVNKRNFIPGSEWIYFKVYTGINFADKLLKFELLEMIEKFLANSKIEKFFFVRYYDDEFHLRLRFQIKINTNYFEVVNALYIILDEFMQKDVVWKVQLDTYKREIERYGSTIVESENIFHYESIAIIKSILYIENSNDENLRWLFGLKCIDFLLSDFNLILDDKIKLLEIMLISFRKEMKLDKVSTKKINLKYMKYKILLNDFFYTKSQNNIFLDNLLLEKSHFTKESITNIINRNSNIDDIIIGHIHMLMNRLFISHNRKTEFVCYELLLKHYKSNKARLKFDENFSDLNKTSFSI